MKRQSWIFRACPCCGTRPGESVPSVAMAERTKAGPIRPIHSKLNAAAKAIESKMIAWRRDIHQNPELGNQETRTAALVATHLKDLGYRVRERVAGTGVVAVLPCTGGSGPVVALRADMDALPILEPVGLPFASRARATWDGQDVPVMHACGHDCHTAILMAAAEVLSRYRDQLRRTLKLLFQPAEENLPQGEIGGARKMIEEDAFAHPKPDAVFGLHVVASLPTGSIGYRPGRSQASSDEFRILVIGRQTHAAYPWAGVDPIVVAAQIVSALQSIESRQVDVAEPSVLTVATINGGSRANIIPGQVVMTGTLRTMSEDRRAFMKRRLNDVAASVASGMGAKATVEWLPNGYPVLVNDLNLTKRMVPSLARVVGPDRLWLSPQNMATEDFSFFAQRAPGLFFWIGITPATQDPVHAPTNHSPLFKVDEAGLLPGLKSMLHLVADYTNS